MWVGLVKKKKKKKKKKTKKENFIKKTCLNLFFFKLIISF